MEAHLPMYVLNESSPRLLPYKNSALYLSDYHSRSVWPASATLPQFQQFSKASGSIVCGFQWGHSGGSKDSH